MKYIIYAGILFLATKASAQSQLSTAEWQKDLRYLQKKVHTDYSNLFHKISKEEFDKAVDQFYAKIPNMKSHEIKVGFAEIVALFEYGHTVLWLIGWRYNEIIDFHQMPYNLYWFNDGIYVQGVHKNYKEALGAKVITIGSMPVEKAINAIKPVVSSENDQFFKGVGLNYLGVPEVMHAKRIIRDISKVTMTLEKNGKQFNITFVPRQSNSFPGNYGLIQSQGQWLDARPVSSTPLWLKHFDKRYYFEYLSKEKTVYVRQSSVIHDEERIEDFYSRVFDFIDNNEVEKLIIDLRLNGGGDNFNNKSVILGLIKSEKINQKGRLFVVIGRRTFSAAQNLVNEIENYTEATFVGEPTAENVNFYGDSRTETLPNSKLSIRLSWAWWQDKDPRDTRKWTAPQVAVELSFKDYVDNTDPIISAIELSSEIELTLSGLTLSRNTKEFKNKIKFYSTERKYDFYNFTNKINQYGYQLMNIERYNEAVSVFELNTELFPDIANNWDSLAEGYWRSGNIAKAREYYNKAIELDPNGRTGENARNMLNRIENQ